MTFRLNHFFTSSKFFLVAFIIFTLFFALPQHRVFGADDPFTLNVYNNATLSGTPSYTSSVTEINARAIPTTNSSVSARWTGTISVPTSATYQFIAESQDGVRIYIDNTLILNKWTAQVGWHALLYTLSAGQHTIKVDYFNLGHGFLNVSWRALNRTVINPIVPTIPTSPTTPTDPTTPIEPSLLRISFVGNPPRMSGGAINTRELNTVISDMHMSSYVFFPQHTASAYPDDYVNYLPTLLGSTNIPVYLDLLGFNHKSVRPDYHDYVAWATDASTLSRSHSNLKGMILDDFYGTLGTGDTFNDSNYIKKIYDAAKANNPNFNLYATLYCTPGREDITKFAADPSRQYITGIYLYTHPSYTTGGIAKPENMIDRCINALHAINKTVVEGVYLDDLDNFAITDAAFKTNINVALKTHPDSFAFYLLQPRQSSGTFNRYTYLQTTLSQNQ